MHDSNLPPPETYRPYLRILADQAQHAFLKQRFDASDVVQDVLVLARVNEHQFNGSKEAEYLAWIRRILKNRLHDLEREHNAGKRAVRLERPIDAFVDDSSRRLDRQLASLVSSPSEKVAKREDLSLVCAALDALPEQQRDAVRLHYFEQLTFIEVAEQLNISRGQAAGLIRRGIAKVRKLCNPDLTGD